MRAVNLLPYEERSGRRQAPLAAVAVAGVGVLAAALLTVGVFSANDKVGERERELGALQQQLANTRQKAKPKPSQPTLSAERQQRLGALNEALTQRLAWDSVLRDVSLVLPDDVWLSNLAAGAPSAEGDAAAGGLSLTFNGFTYSQEGVARLLSRLALVPTFGNVKLEKSTATIVGKQKIVNFTVLADVLKPGGTS